MDRVKHFAAAETPVPGSAWLALDESERIKTVLETLDRGPTSLSSQIQVATAKPDGQVIVRLKESLSAAQRGPLLLDLEAYLKESIDEALVVWLEPLGDRNSLRNLRGIEVKA